MASVNKAILIGNLGADPEVRYMPNGDAVTNITMATSETWKDKSGEKQEKTEWHRVTFFRKLAEIVGEYLKKGAKIYVEGRIETRKWKDKEGVDRYTTEIIANNMVMLGASVHTLSDKDPAYSPADKAAKVESSTKVDSNIGQGGFGDMDDDIPF